MQVAIFPPLFQNKLSQIGAKNKSSLWKMEAFIEKT
jgi:hypothetical protein